MKPMLCFMEGLLFVRFLCNGRKIWWNGSFIKKNV